MPLVSVVIPTFNYGRFVASAIQSALDQTFRDFEIVVVDDGSTDDTTEIVSRFGAAVRYIYQPNRGLSAARNRGIQAARGEWIGFLDADDLWLPTKLERQLSVLNGTAGGRVVVHSNYAILDEDGGIQLKWSQPGLNNPFPESLRSELSVRDFVFKNWVGVLTALVRRHEVESIGGFDNELRGAEDWDLWLRLALAGHRFVYVEDSLAIYRWHRGSMQSAIDQMLASRLRLLDKLFARPDLPLSVRSLRRRAYARLYYMAAVDRYYAGQRLRMLASMWRMLTMSPHWGLVRIASVLGSRLRGVKPRYG